MEAFKEAVTAVMNASGVSTGRGTHYNTVEQEMQARLEAGRRLFTMDRSVFMLVHALDDVTDHARQTAVKAMLMNNWERYPRSSLGRGVELQGIRHLVDALPANRAINLIIALREDRVNNSRTRKRLILEFLLNHPKLEWWAVKYRRKLRKALEHAWGKQAAGAIRATLNKGLADGRPKGFKARLDKYLNSRTESGKVYESVAFILDCDVDFTRPLFKSFEAAKSDISLGAMLPPEVLEGIRSTCHASVSQKRMLELTRDTSMTEKKKSLVQRKAAKENVRVAFNPMARTAVELYILAYAQGMTDTVWQALVKKGRNGAKALPFRFGKVGILVDDSWSMTGAETQQLRPMAVALSMKDVLIHTGATHVVRTASGRAIDPSRPLPRPVGETDLSMAFVDLLESRVDAVFILTDGYENAPSGRMDEIMHVLDRQHRAVPVYQLTPAVAGETRAGLKVLSDKIPAIPVSNAQALSLTLVRALIEVDFKRGIQALARVTLPKINRISRSELTET